MRLAGRIILFLIFGLAAQAASAHEMRPAFLSVRESSPNLFALLWKVPALGDLRLGLYVRMPDGCAPVADPVKGIDDEAYTERWSARCAAGLHDGAIRIEGLSATMTDALVRVEYADGSTEVAHLTPERPTFVAAGAQSGWQVAQTYFVLGVDHILSGIDHLLFVLALILLIHDRWMLLKTITAFTLAHSLTLAGASLGLFSLPQRPVEAAIALSIAFVARELVLVRAGEARLSTRVPWLVAFAFGLLHGFGFAGALRETGLPQTDVPLALLTFNLGVEAGQLMFVALVLSLALMLRRAARLPIVDLRRSAAYGIGTISMFWLVTRLAAFVLPA